MKDQGPKRKDRPKYGLLPTAEFGKPSPHVGIGAADFPSLRILPLFRLRAFAPLREIHPGGSTLELTALRKDLRASTAEGTATSVMVGIGETYLPAFVLALSANQLACGLVSTVPLLAGAVLQLVSPRMVRREGAYRRWVVCCAAIQAGGVRALAGRRPAGASFPWWPGVRPGDRLLGGRHGLRGGVERLGGDAGAAAAASPLFRPPRPGQPMGRDGRFRRRRPGVAGGWPAAAAPCGPLPCCSWWRPPPASSRPALLRRQREPQPPGKPAPPAAAGKADDLAGPRHQRPGAGLLAAQPGRGAGGRALFHALHVGAPGPGLLPLRGAGLRRLAGPDRAAAGLGPGGRARTGRNGCCGSAPSASSPCPPCGSCRGRSPC